MGLPPVRSGPKDLRLARGEVSILYLIRPIALFRKQIGAVDGVIFGAAEQD